MYEIIPLTLFGIIITLIFYKILSTTKSVLIFVSILFAFYIIFRYLMTQYMYIFDKESMPIATKDDLDKYKLEAGVELRELQSQK